MSPKFNVIDMFSRRPALRDVALARLRTALNQQFPDLEIDPEICHITRTIADGGQRSETLLHNFHHAFLSGKSARWRTGANTLVLNPGIPDAPASPVDFDQLNVLIDTVSLELTEQFQRAVIEFWGTPPASGASPWACVSNALKHNFSSAVAGAHLLRGDDREFLRAIAAFTEKTQRNFMLQIDEKCPDDFIRVCIPHQVCEVEDVEGAPLPVLAATGVWRGTEVFFSWQSPGDVVTHSSLADLMSSFDAAQSGASAAIWALREPDEDAFDALAQSILDHQLQRIARADRADAVDFTDFERRMCAATDIAPYLLRPVPGVESADKLPDWLCAASATDRVEINRRMIDLAAVQARSNGQSFRDNLPPLLNYAHQQLQRELLANHPEATDLLIADLTVIINAVVAVAIPSGGQVVASGAVEPVRMSVAEFALANLSGVPAGALRVVRRDGTPAPDWFTADYLRLLVCQVDIGRHYPALVERYLVTDRAEASRRQALYVDQLRAQLPLEALERKLRAEGFCDKAYRLVAALMQPPEQRSAQLRETTLRALAFRATAGAQADPVVNMFVISERDTGKGPVVLYRPLSRHTLTEFSSWAALRTAIVQPGELHDEVLTWMGDHAQQVYANGGFDQPHVLRFGQGSEFAPLEIPPPAQLAFDEVDGDPLAALFNANAAALVQLADRHSTSNAESRWALLKRGGWLALDSVMPFITGPAGSAAWLMQLMTQMQSALSLREDAGPVESSESLANLLLTVGMLLLHGSFGGRGSPGRRQAPGLVRPRLADLLTSPTAAPEPAITAVSPSVRTLLDFSWSRPDLALTPHQKTSLQSFEIVPWPELPELPEPSGAVSEGLYQLRGNWYARVGDALFRVRVGEDEVLIVDPEDLKRTGPRLVRDGKVWQLDLSLRLRGGGPKRSARQLAQENAARLKLVNAEKSELLDRQQKLYSRIVENDNRLDGLPLDQHSAVISLIETDIRAVIDIIDRKNALDQQLRPADRTSDKVYAMDLQGVTRRVCLLEGVLLSDMLTLAKDNLTRMRTVSTQVTAENVGIYRELFEKSLQLQEAGVHWSMVREGLWQRLRDVPKVGDAYWRAETLTLYNSRMFAHVEWRASRMWSSLELCFSVEGILDSSKAVTLKRLLTDDALHAALTSQAELEKPHDYTIAEQIDVLESSLREYERASNVALAAYESEPEVVDTTHFQRFFDDLSAISDRAEHRLSELIRDSEEPADKPAEYVPRVAQTRKRVIRTRGQRTLIGRLREGAEPALGEVVELKAATGDRVIGSYHLHAEGEWVELEEQRPKPVSQDSVVPLGELLRRGRASLERVEPDIANAVRQSRRANEPEDMEDILVQKADKLRSLIEALQVHAHDPATGEGSAPSLLDMLNDLRAGEARFREQGRHLRIEMIKRQPPTASRISYLDRQQEVSIARFEGRKNMSGARRNDFVQEYVIRDKGGQALWWAHFHYASENAPADAFTAAHLKLPEQRLMGYKALLKAAKDNKEVVSVYRSAIGRQLAQRLFLHLAD